MDNQYAFHCEKPGCSSKFTKIRGYRQHQKEFHQQESSTQPKSPSQPKTLSQPSGFLYFGPRPCGLDGQETTVQSYISGYTTPWDRSHRDNSSTAQSSPRWVKCPHCEASFLGERGRDDHMRTDHTWVRCSMCGNLCERGRGMAIHVSKMHKELRLDQLVQQSS